MSDHTFNERLPGSNHDAPQGAESRKFEQAEIANQFSLRQRLLMGLEQQASLAYGVVAQTDPAAPATTDGLLVTADAGSATVSVSPGFAVTKSGFVIELETAVTGIKLSDFTEGAHNVVLIKWQTEESADQLINSRGALAGVTFERSADSDLVEIRTVASFLALSEDVRQHMVPLALVYGIGSIAAAYTITVDHSRSTYSWMRPWFSVVDHQHRSLLGTGTVTTNNPHGLGISDIAAGEMTLLQAMLRTGALVSKDYDVDRIPGFLCEEDLDMSRFKEDTTGAVTGVAGATYIELLDIPTQLGRCIRDYDVSNTPDHEDLSPWLLRGTNVLVFDAAEVTPNPLIGGTVCTVWYMKAGGGMTKNVAQDLIDVTQLDSSREMLVTSGQIVTSINDTLLNLRGYRPIPQVLRAFVKPTGDVVTVPTLVQCATRLDSMGTIDLSAVELLGPSRLVVALADLVSPPAANLDVQILLTGTDREGNAINETIAFDPDWYGYAPPAPGGALASEADSRYTKLVTQNLFASTISAELVAAVGAPGAAIAIFALPDWRHASDMRDLACLGTILWDGLTVNSILDGRRVCRSLHDEGERHTQASLAFQAATSKITGLSSLLGAPNVAMDSDGNQEVWFEDFNNPRWAALKMHRSVLSTSDFGFSQIDDATFDGAEFLAMWDRWADGLGLYTMEYPSPKNAQPVYISRAMRMPMQGSLTPFSSSMTMTLIRHYLDDTNLGDASPNTNHVTGAGGAREAKLLVRYNSADNADNVWSAWHEFAAAGGGSRAIDTFTLTTPNPATNFLRKVQFAVVGNARALAVKFDSIAAVAAVEEPTSVAEITLLVDGTKAAVAAGSSGFAEVSVVVPEARIRAPGAVVDPPIVGVLGNAPNWVVEDPFGANLETAIFYCDFEFNGAALAHGDYSVHVTPMSTDALVGSTSAVHPATVGVRTDLAWHYRELGGAVDYVGQAGRFVIALRPDGAPNSDRNFMRFLLTIRVPL